MEEAAAEGVDSSGEGVERGWGNEHVPFCIAQIEVEIMHTECAERTSVIVRVQRIQRLQYFEYLMPPAKLYFVLAADSSTTTSRYPVKWLLSSFNSLAACQCLSPVTCRSSPALALSLTLTATLMQCSRCQRVLCVLYHIPCYVIQRPQGRKRRREGAWQGGQLLHSMCAAGSGIISNCVCTFAMQQQHLLLLFLQLLVPLERLDVCNLPAQHILHKLPPPSLSYTPFS